MEKTDRQTGYEIAKNRVDDEKKFYSHLSAYLIINIFFLLMNSNFIDEEVNKWFDWNLYVTPFFWGIGLFFHWITTFNPNIIFIKKWEEQKIKQLMAKDDTLDVF
ncbi:2TM domain-containing protein [uncultured Aquimarina sp.]|uniref:2TM domain-containing protein n=1 Tax=uncultured Aquimarina sp. TaxID=575652 RepID=UPI002609D74F|nr:2TM domain-containing protein [uncultured Aquimarina sp.]